MRTICSDASGSTGSKTKPVQGFNNHRKTDCVSDSLAYLKGREQHANSKQFEKLPDISRARRRIHDSAAYIHTDVTRQTITKHA